MVQTEGHECFSVWTSLTEELDPERPAATESEAASRHYREIGMRTGDIAALGHDGPHVLSPVPFKRLRKVVKRQRTILGVVMREVRRKLDADKTAIAAGGAPAHEAISPKAISDLETFLQRAERIRTQQRNTKNKLEALHAPEVECISGQRGSAAPNSVRRMMVQGREVERVASKTGRSVHAELKGCCRRCPRA